MSDDDTCPHCNHRWSGHATQWMGGHRRCYCGCMWKQPEPEAPVVEVDPLTDTFRQALWAAFQSADNCYADPELSIIDTGGNWESFSMYQVADTLLNILEQRGYPLRHLKPYQRAEDPR